MVQERLIVLAVMACENDILGQLNFEDVLNDFISRKLRRVNV